MYLLTEYYEGGKLNFNQKGGDLNGKEKKRQRQSKVQEGHQEVGH